MKILVFLLLSSLMIETVYAQQRLSDVHPGDPCTKISETEKRLKSLDLAVPEGKGVSRYTGIQGGEKAAIVYHCSKGRLVEQTITVTKTTREEAYRFANEQKAELTKQLGDPVHDGLDLSILKRLYFAFVGADLDYLVGAVIWGTSKEDAMLLVKEIGTNHWEVTISQGSSKMEYILNS